MMDFDDSLFEFWYRMRVGIRYTLGSLTGDVGTIEVLSVVSFRVNESSKDFDFLWHSGVDEV